MLASLIDWLTRFSIAEWLKGIAALVTISAGAVTFWRWLKKRSPAKPRWKLGELELVPIRFEVHVGPGNVPEARVVLRAINYLTREIRVSDLKVPLLQLSGGPNVDDLASSDHYDVRAQSSLEVYCRRRFVPGEADEIRAAAQRHDISQATLMFTAHGKVRKRERWRLQKREVEVSEINRSIYGSIHGVPLHPWNALGTVPLRPSDKA